VALFRLDATRYRFIWLFNYMLQDGWSYPILVRDALSSAGAIAGGNEEPIGPAGPRFREYIAWVDRQSPDRAERYWRRTLAGFTAATPLVSVLGGQTTGGPGVGGAGYTKAQVELPVSVTAALRSQARRHQLTVHTLVQAAWAVVLGARTALDDVVFGSVVSARPAAVNGIEDVVGCLNNFLPTRVRIARDGSLVDWLRSLQAEHTQARHHGEYCSPLTIAGWTEVPRGELLFESYLVFENLPMDEAVERRLRTWTVLGGTVQTEHPLRIVVWPFRSLLIRMEHYEKYLRREDVRQLLDDLGTVLSAMAASLDRVPGELSALMPTTVRSGVANVRG
jgi:hypothetical protein